MDPKDSCGHPHWFLADEMSLHKVGKLGFLFVPLKITSIGFQTLTRGGVIYTKIALGTR